MQIRTALEADLREVECWLNAECEATGEGFHCNWSIIEGCYQDSKLQVLRVDGSVVAFLCDALKGPDIIEVHPDHRRRGYGRALMNTAIQNAWVRGNSVIEIDCAPPESAAIWERLGFTIRHEVRRNGFAIPGYMLLPRRFTLSGGPDIEVTVGFYPESRQWEELVKPFWVFSGMGVQIGQTTIQLPERLVFFDPEVQNLADCHVRIEVGGKEVVRLI